MAIAETDEACSVLAITVGRSESGAPARRPSWIATAWMSR